MFSAPCANQCCLVTFFHYSHSSDVAMNSAVQTGIPRLLLDKQFILYKLYTFSKVFSIKLVSAAFVFSISTNLMGKHESRSLLRTAPSSHLLPMNSLPLPFALAPRDTLHILL